MTIPTNCYFYLDTSVLEIEWTLESDVVVTTEHLTGIVEIRRCSSITCIIKCIFNNKYGLGFQVNPFRSCLHFVVSACRVSNCMTNGL